MQIKMVKNQTIALAFLFFALTGCGTSAPVRFYMLNSISGPVKGASVAERKTPVSIGIGPVEFPAYLDRQQIVTRISENEVDLAMFHEWAGRLKEDFIRVLVENLAALDTGDLFAVYPMRGSSPADFHLEMEVLRLDGALGGNVLLVARWAVFGRGGEQMLLTRKSMIREPTGAADYGSLVAAESRAVESLSREIAEVMNGLSNQVRNK